VKLDLLWFGGDSNKSKQNEKDQGGQKESKSKMGTTATTMDNFKQSQELGKKTGALLTELSAATVEGTAAKGKIKVILDGEQRPKLVEIDEEYFDGVAVEDFTEALTSAMQDAYLKSTNLMEEKMIGLYTELGLPPTKQ
jgi:DNA-binding YbaB/EbfC family protein